MTPQNGNDIDALVREAALALAEAASASATAYTAEGLSGLVERGLEQLSALVLHEGLGSFVKNLATGDIDDDIKELTAEVKDVKTPEQQKIVLGKILNMLERLISLRHGKAALARFVHGAADWFSKHVSGEPAREMDLRVGEAISDLASLRDKLLAHQWEQNKPGEPDYESAAELRKAAAESLNRVKAAEDHEF